MKAKLITLWPSLATAASGLVVFLTPSVQAYAGGHKGASIAVLTLWGIALHWAQSPRAK